MKHCNNKFKNTNGYDIFKVGFNKYEVFELEKNSESTWSYSCKFRGTKREVKAYINHDLFTNL